MKNQFYFVGEMGEENEIKYMSSRQKNEHFRMHNKMQKEMAHI